MLVRLDDPAASVRALCGSKAATLADAMALHLPVLPGFVMTTAAAGDAGVRQAWEDLTDGGRTAVVVRSSSTAEDREDSSMAGRYESVVDVRGWEAFLDAVEVVLDSRQTAAEGVPDLTGDEPLAVLVQPMLHARVGGVLFGVDPVTGRRDRIVVAASTDGVDAVVSGRSSGSRYVLDREGAVVESDEGTEGAVLDGDDRRRLVALADQVAEAFGGPQDVEWAIRDSGELVLLQSRPVTTTVVGPPQGPLFGRGPVAETFPGPLSRLEEELWVPPLRLALVEALGLAGAATDEVLQATPLVVAVRGHVAVDLEATGEVAATPTIARRLDPRPRVRRLLSAWRIGRLRTALPTLAEAVVRTCDGALAAVPELPSLTDRQLLALLTRGGHALMSIHAHEVLMGQLVRHDAPRLTGTSVALRVLAHARASGTPEEEIPRQHPVVLTLVPPRIAPDIRLPRGVEAPPWRGDGERDRDAVLRESLRLRVRWVQELTARAAWELGERLRERGLLDEAGDVRRLGLDELRRAVLDGARPAPPEGPGGDDGGAVPVRFRLSADGEPVPETGSSAPESGTGAGGGRATGTVRHDVGDVEEGDVLVVPTLDPSLAPVLPRLAALVAETGSVLAHIAILAREAGLPTVVAASGATARFPAGTVVTVDGATGEISPRGEP